MRNLLHAIDRDRLVAHLRGALLREVSVGGQRLMALAEADDRAEDGFCAAADNAVAAELLAQPEVRDSDPAFADALLDFTVAMADAPVPSRRAAFGGIAVLRDDPRDFEILTAFHRFTGDLSRGVIRQQIRNGAAFSAPVQHTGNLVEFRIGRHRAGVDAEDSIASYALRRVGSTVLLVHESRIMGTAGLLRGRPVQAGTLRLTYEIGTGSPLLRLTVGFTAAQAGLSRLRLSTAVDQLDADGLDLAEGRVAGDTGWRDFGVPQQPGIAVWADGVPAPHLAVGRASWPEGGPVLHIRPQAPGGVMGVRAQAVAGGALHWLILRHGPVDLAPGASFEVVEDRLLAAGTPAEAGATVMAAAGRARAAMEGLDLDPMPPSGAALNAVATTLLFASRGGYRVPLAVPRIAALEAWLARRLAEFPAAEASLEDLAQAVLAAEARLRAGGDPAPFRALLAALLARQRPHGGFQPQGGAVAGVAGRTGALAPHAAALLALARAVPHVEPERLAGPIARALGLVRPGPAEAEQAAAAMPVPGLRLEGAPLLPLAQFAVSVAGVARAAGAVLLAAELRPQAVPAEVAAQAQALHRQAVALLRPLIRARDGLLEVLPSPLGGAARPAGQAAAVLGLMAPDAAILRQVPVSA